MTEQAGTGALDAAIDAAREVFITAPLDLRGRSLIAAMLRAAAPLIPVTPQQRADIERDALLRAAEAVEAEIPHGSSWFWYQLGETNLAEVGKWLRARAASVGTEEGRDG